MLLYGKNFSKRKVLFYNIYTIFYFILRNDLNLTKNLTYDLNGIQTWLMNCAMTDFLKLVNIENNKARGSCSIATINGAQSIAALKLSRSNKKLYSSGAYYIGNLLGTQRDGYGKLHWSLGCEYEGHYCKNKRDGRGTITWKDGSFYKGDFKNDLRHGYGEIKFPNGEVCIFF